MKKAIAAMILLIFMTSATLVAQDYRLYPEPNPPEFGKTMAPQVIWIYDSTVKYTPEGYVFSAKVKTIFYAGLDEEGNRIAYKYPKKKGEVVKQDEPNKFEIIDEIFAGTAYLKVGVDRNVVARTKFKVTGGLSDDDDDKKAGEMDGIIEFEPIKTDVKLLPTMYRIAAEINPKSQHSFYKYIWIDKEERIIDKVSIIRDDPRRAIPISVDAFLLLKEDERGRLESFKEGAISYYESALKSAENVKEVEKQISDIQEKIKVETDEGKLSNLEITLYKLLDDLSVYKFWASDSINKALKTELAKAKLREKEFKLAVHLYDRQAKIAIVGVLDSIYDFYYEVYYTSYGCSPTWRTKKKDKMKELDKKFKISKYLTKGKPGEDVEIGAWKKDKWMDNLNDNWMVKIKEIKDNFRRIFGNAMTDPKASEKDPGYWGITEDGKRTFWEPAFKTGYEELYEKLFDDDILTKTIKSLANFLTSQHNKAKVIDYPFVKEGTIDPDPSPTTANSYVSILGQLKKLICPMIYSCSIPPAELINPEDLKNADSKRKTEWVCPNCKAKSAHRPREGKCPVCKTPMKEQPIKKDDGGVSEGGR